MMHEMMLSPAESPGQGPRTLLGTKNATVNMASDVYASCSLHLPRRDTYKKENIRTDHGKFYEKRNVVRHWRVTGRRKV